MVNIKKLEGTINGRKFWVESFYENYYNIYAELKDCENVFIKNCKADNFQDVVKQAKQICLTIDELENIEN